MKLDQEVLRLIEMLNAERFDAHSAHRSATHLRWIASAGLLAGAVTFVATVATVKPEQIGEFGVSLSARELLGIAFLIGAVVAIVVLGFNVYFETRLAWASYRAALAERKMTWLAGRNLMHVGLHDTRFDHQKDEGGEVAERRKQKRPHSVERYYILMFLIFSLPVAAGIAWGTLILSTQLWLALVFGCAAWAIATLLSVAVFDRMWDGIQTALRDDDEDFRKHWPEGVLIENTGAPSC